MSGTSGNNLPVKVTLEGADEFNRAIRGLAEEMRRPVQVAEEMAPALNRAGDAFTALERRTQGAGRAVQDLRGAMELLGASGVAGGLGQVAGVLGNVGDALSTASLAAGRFDGVVAGLSTRLASLASLAAVPLFLQSVGLGINQAGEAADSAVGAVERYRNALERLAPTLDEIADKTRRLGIEQANLRAGELEAEFGRLLESRGAAVGQLAGLDGRVESAAAQLARAQQRLDTAGGSGRANARDLAALAEEVTAARSRLDEVTRQRDELRGQISGMVGPSTFDELQGRINRLYEPFQLGPNLPTNPASSTRGGGGRGGSAREPAMFGDQMVGQFWRAQQQQAAAAEREQQQYLARIEAANERTTDSIVRYAGDAFADLFGNLSGGWEQTMARFRQTALQTFARIAAEAVLRPIIAPVVSSLGLGGGVQAVGSSLFGGSGLGGLGLGGVEQWLGGLGGSVSGLMSTPLWGNSVAAAGMFAEAPAAAMGISSGQAAAMTGLGPTLGAGLAGVGGGFMLGSTVGGLIAQSPAQQTNSQVGAGGGALAGAAVGTMILPGVGTVIGGLLGGLLGGAGGGLIGPGMPNEGFNIQLQADGGFGISDARERGRGEQLVSAYLQTEAELQQANALLSALGITASGGSALGEDPNNPRVPRSFAQTIGDFRFSAPGNDNLNRALSGRSVGSLNELQDIAGFVSLYESIVAVREPVSAFQQQLDAINAQFDALTTRARDLNLSEEGLNAARARSIAQLEDARRAEEEARRAEEEARRDQAAGTLTGGVTGLTDFIRGLRTSSDNPLNPQARLAAARSDFASLASTPGAASLNRLRGSAEAFLSASRDVYGTGRGFASDFNATLTALENFAGAGSDMLTASAAADIQRSNTEILQAELVALRAEIAGLRREVQQGAANPLAARAA